MKRPSEILQKHLDFNPSQTMVASFHADGTVQFDISMPGNLADLVFMHKLLGKKLDALLDASMRAASEETPKP